MFASTNESLCNEFSYMIQGEFEISLMGKLIFSLGLQIKQTKMKLLSISQNTAKSF